VHDLSRLSAEDIVDLGVAMVPEGRRLFPRLTVLENLMLGAFRKAARRNIDHNLAVAFETFPVLKERQGQLAGTMSGGQQQMLAIGRALMAKPRLLLLDEPSMGLAPMLVQQIMNALQVLRHEGLTILLVEQNAQAALSIADRGFVMETGNIAAAASTAELMSDERVRAAYLGAS